jgi:hypothetical protein
MLYCSFHFLSTFKLHNRLAGSPTLTLFTLIKHCDGDPQRCYKERFWIIYYSWKIVLKIDRIKSLGLPYRISAQNVTYVQGYPHNCAFLLDFT